MHPMIARGLARIESQQQQEIMEIYELFDQRNRGFIDASSMAEAMKTLGYQTDRKQIYEMMQVIVKGKSNLISKKQFQEFMISRLDYRDTAQKLQKAYDYFDNFKRGKILNKDLMRVAEEIGESVQQCPKMVLEADKDLDGAISEQEFMRVIKKTSLY